MLGLAKSSASGGGGGDSVGGGGASIPGLPSSFRTCAGEALIDPLGVLELDLMGLAAGIGGGGPREVPSGDAESFDFGISFLGLGTGGPTGFVAGIGGGAPLVATPTGAPGIGGVPLSGAPINALGLDAGTGGGIPLVVAGTEGGVPLAEGKAPPSGPVCIPPRDPELPTLSGVPGPPTPV